MVLIAGLIMLVCAIAVQVQNRASLEELFFTFLFIVLITGAVQSGVSGARRRDSKRDADRLAEEYKLKRARLAEEYKLKKIEMKGVRNK